MVAGAALAMIARGALAGGSSVTLAWDPSVSGGIAGYRVYEGTNSHAYTTTVSAGAVTQTALSGLTTGVTYYFAVTAYDANGLESDFSSEVSYTPNGATNQSGLVFASDSGNITSPFIASNGIVWQAVQTVATNGGRAAYNFSIARPGAYTVSALVNAPNASANSFYVNVDTEPADPQNLWDIPVTTGFTNRAVSWNTSGSPQLFNLAAGNHQLIIRGREPNTQLGTITISPAYGVLQIARGTNRSILLSGLGQIGHLYDVQASTDLKTWTTIGSVSPDTSGIFSFTDPGPATLPRRVYRLHDQTASGLAALGGALGGVHL
jgi:fibronectin type 3 domain-containing protein